MVFYAVENGTSNTIIYPSNWLDSGDTCENISVNQTQIQDEYCGVSYLLHHWMGMDTYNYRYVICSDY